MKKKAKYLVNKPQQPVYCNKCQTFLYTVSYNPAGIIVLCEECSGTGKQEIYVTY